MAQGCGYGTSEQDCQHQQRDESARRDSDYNHQQEIQSGTADITYNPSFMPMVERDIRWSAFAMDKKKLLVTDKEMKFIGVSKRHKSMKDAKKVALSMCESDGSDDCEIIETVANACISISISPEANKLEYSFNPNMQISMDNSMRQCQQKYKGCKMAYANCSND
jgi:hypothetical protein